MNNNFSTHRYLIQTIDPVHIGTGGMRLGRVDNSIVREPGTKLPKIPGTSLSGAIRSYSAYRYNKRNCAGQKNHCGLPTCPICYTFGSISEEEGKQKSFSGVISIGDARIILFPVYSMAGPVWVTSPSALAEFGIIENLDADEAKMTKGVNKYPYLNLGWLMVKKGGEFVLDKLPLLGPVNDRVVLISDKLFSQVINNNLEVRTSVSINPETGAAEPGALFTYEAIPRAAFLWMDLVVDDYRKAFPTFNLLENWKKILTGAEFKNTEAYDLLRKLNLIENNGNSEKNFNKAQKYILDCIKDEIPHYTNGTLPGEKSWKVISKSAPTSNTPITYPEAAPADVFTAGLEWIKSLGVGGMGTRGFGRVDMVASGSVDKYNVISWNKNTIPNSPVLKSGGKNE
jgi:CRISPR-associated protein Cmr4